MEWREVPPGREHSELSSQTRAPGSGLYAASAAAWRRVPSPVKAEPVARVPPWVEMEMLAVPSWEKAEHVSRVPSQVKAEHISLNHAHRNKFLSAFIKAWMV